MGMKQELGGAAVLVLGGGIIGLTLALELARRGARVTVLEKGTALGAAASGASVAAAGMLAAEDPHNPMALRSLSLLSIGLYPTFLEELAELSGVRVPFQTDTVVQYGLGGGVSRMREWSIDPRQLVGSLRGAVEHGAVTLREGVGATEVFETANWVEVRTGAGGRFEADDVVYASGAWFAAVDGVRPLKGQMLRVRLPSSLPLREVHRSEGMYVVPRTAGPQAGTALIGATVEDVGFNMELREEALRGLRERAATMLPELGDPAQAPEVEAWAGLRPATPDRLPLLGRLPGARRRWVATGHFRNGVLLAPGTARVMAGLIAGEVSEVELGMFDPGRFGLVSS